MIKVAYSVKLHAHDAVEDLKLQLGGLDPRVILCFASTRQEPHELLRLINQAYPHALVNGATTAGEIVSGKVLKGGVVAMALESDIVEKAVAVVVDDLGPRMDVDAAIANLEKHFGVPLAGLDPDRHVGIVITDGLSGAEERLIEAINEKTEIAFVGGSAGDDLKFEKTLVFSGKTVHERSAILLLMKVPRGFEVVKTQSFKPTGIVLEATDVDVE
ncbi:MAG: FIST N-terminal domain-containing protein, partial [Fibrobacterota bacterium]